MADFNTTNSNNDNQKHMQTRVTTYTNGKAAVPSALSVTYYDDGVRLVFAPELPKNEQTERRRYDYNNTVMTFVRRAKCHELYKAYKEVIVPAIKNGENARVSIPLAGVNQLMIDTDVDSTNTPCPKIKYIKAIDANTLIADEKNIISYEFNTGEYILGYNEKTGDFKDRVITYNELELFMEDLNSIAIASSNAYVHADRVVNKYWRETLDTKLVKIGDKMGLDLAYRPSRPYGSGSQGSIFNTRSNVDTGAPSTTVGSIDDINSMIAGDMDLPY